jgi:membrane-associated HD superfamily phosphohydrolase
MSASDDKAGVLSMLRQGAGLTTLQCLFDQLDRAMILLGKLEIDIIQANFTPGKIKKILEGEEPTQQFYNKDFGKYHANVEEGLNTSTQKQMQFAQMLQLKEMGVPISPEDLLEAATLQNKQRIIDNLTKTEQAQQQQQQQQAEMAMQLQQAQIELAQARAKADIGLYEERTSRVDENRALAIQKLHEANSDDEKAMLDKVKALKELETMDLEHIERLINMSNSLREQERLASESIANKEVAELKGAQ